MGRHVYKYKLVPGINEVDTYAGWTFLTIQGQGGHVCMWAIVDTRSRPAKERIHLVGTGWDLPEFARRQTYLGTAQTPSPNPQTSFVWHAFLE